MLIRMICGSPQTDEEQQEKTRGKRKRKKKMNASRRRRRKKRRGEGEASSDAHRLLYTYPSIFLHSLSLSLSCFLPFFLIDTFLPSFSPHLLPLSLILCVTFPPCIYRHTLLVPTRRKREREREDRALGPWRNQFKWLSVDVIDFHFTRLSRGRRSSTRCVASTPTPEHSCSLSCVRASLPSSLFFSLSPSLRIFRVSRSVSSSLGPPVSFSFFFAPAAHACDAYARNNERINTHYNVSAGAPRQERAALPGIIVFSRLVPR